MTSTTTKEGALVNIRKSRRRSSLFLDRTAFDREIEESVDSSSVENGVVFLSRGAKNEEQALLAKIADLEACNRNWRSYKKELKETLASTKEKESQMLTESMENYLDYLDDDIKPLVTRIVNESQSGIVLSETLSEMKLQCSVQLEEFDALKQRAALLCDMFRLNVGVKNNERYNEVESFLAKFDRSLSSTT